MTLSMGQYTEGMNNKTRELPHIALTIGQVFPPLAVQHPVGFCPQVQHIISLCLCQAAQLAINPAEMQCRIATVQSCKLHTNNQWSMHPSKPSGECEHIRQLRGPA